MVPAANVSVNLVRINHWGRTSCWPVRTANAFRLDNASATVLYIGKRSWDVHSDDGAKDDDYNGEIGALTEAHVGVMIVGHPPKHGPC